MVDNSDTELDATLAAQPNEQLDPNGDEARRLLELDNEEENQSVSQNSSGDEEEPAFLLLAAIKEKLESKNMFSKTETSDLTAKLGKIKSEFEACIGKRKSF